MSGDLKTSTAKLVRQLHENPDVAGNDKMIEKHKQALVALINSCCEEQLHELKFEKFEREIKDKLQDQQRYHELKQIEREKTQSIQKLTARLKEEMDKYATETSALENDISERRKIVNETEIEAQLHLQYTERKLKGEQDCEARKYNQKETALQEEIARLKRELHTEEKVTAAIQSHLKNRIANFRDSKKELEERSGEQAHAQMLADIDEIKNKITKTEEDIHDLELKLALDRQQKVDRDREEQKQRDKEKAIEDHKKAMEEAAAGIQQKWFDWKELPASWKKKKKKGKGKKKKKK